MPSRRAREMSRSTFWSRWKAGSSLADKAPSVPDAPALDEMPLPALDLDAMKDRYPLLRNAL